MTPGIYVDDVNCFIDVKFAACLTREKVFG